MARQTGEPPVGSEEPAGPDFLRDRREQQVQMIVDYYAFLERRPSRTFCPVELLPHPKDALVEALLTLIANARSRSEMAHGALAIATLAYFQPEISAASWPQ